MFQTKLCRNEKNLVIEYKQCGQSAFGLELGELMSQTGTGILGPIRHRIPTNEQAAFFLQGRIWIYSSNFHEKSSLFLKNSVKQNLCFIKENLQLVKFESL